MTKLSHLLIIMIAIIHRYHPRRNENNVIIIYSTHSLTHHHHYHHHHFKSMPSSLQSRARDDIPSHDSMIIPDRSKLVCGQPGHTGDPALMGEGDLELHVRTSEVPHIDVLIEGSCIHIDVLIEGSCIEGFRHFISLDERVLDISTA